MKLFDEPIKLKSGMEIRNRLMFPPTVVFRADLMTAEVTDNLLDMYTKLAASGAGIIVQELTFVMMPIPSTIGCHHDGMIPGLEKMVAAVKSVPNPPKFFVQFGMPMPGMNNVSEIPADMIEMCVYLHIDGAERLMKAGYDGVEIHGAHSYMTAAMISHRNKRTDEWGGSFENRMNFPKRVFEGIKERCGDDFQVAIRMNGDDFIVGGNTLQQTTKIAPFMADLGAEYISVSAGAKAQDAWQPIDTYMLFPYPKPEPWDGDGNVRGYSGHRCVPPGYMPDCTNVYLAEAIKESVEGKGVPVITAGKISTIDQAEQVLQKGKADMVAICRSIFADHEWAIKQKAGKSDDVVWCTWCNECMDSARRGNPTTCPLWTENNGKMPEGTV
ncbi:MAG: NADH:flavin oxidoreductase [Deltaproteobacteria bacterium]|nr:NADH:flavin oxidoreductase [Deltaproteobacteria bacterium]